MPLKPAALALLIGATPALADITVDFIEGAPKDRFVLRTTGACPTGPIAVTIDLAPAAGGVIFDTTGSGAGVEVFQPFELVSGASQVVSPPSVSDGDQTVTLSLSTLTPQTPVAFTVDVDDTGGGREITVSGSEIEGARVTVVQGGSRLSADMSARAQARVGLDACLS